MRFVLAATMALLMGSSVATTATDTTRPPSELLNRAETLVQQVREGADSSVLDQAESLYQELLATEAADAQALTGLGGIALSRHRFDEALELGEQARALAPRSARPLGVVADALIELGRYDEAAATLDEMLRARPDLASFTRLSYFHELHGDLDLAIDAMERAVIAGGPTTENTEFARVKLGDLWLLDGDHERAAGLYDDALERLPDYVPALHGLAKVALVGDDVAAAERHLLHAVRAAALPETIVQLGTLQEASGQPDLSAATFATAVAMERFHRDSSGVPEPFGAVLEADHGDEAVSLQIAREIYQDSASIGAADALAWALHINGHSDDALEFSREALRTGSHDPSILYHAGVIALAAGEDEQARQWLEDALASSAGGPAMLRADIEAALAEL